MTKAANKEEEKKQEEEKSQVQEEEAKFDSNDIETLLSSFKKVLSEVPKSSKAFSETLIGAEEFEKDND